MSFISNGDELVLFNGASRSIFLRLARHRVRLTGTHPLELTIPGGAVRLSACMPAPGLLLIVG